MDKRPTKPTEHDLPVISHRQANVVILGLQRMLAATLAELAERAGPRHAFAFKAKLIRDVKNLIPGGVSADEEADAIRWLIAMVDATIAEDKNIG